MKSIKPFLFFNGNCREAMNFYKECLQGEITTIQTYGESPIDFPEVLNRRIFNSELIADQVRIMASDVPEDFEEAVDRRFSMFLTVTDAGELKRLSERLSEDGKITMALDSGFCMLIDKFGIQWMLAKD